MAALDYLTLLNSSNTDTIPTAGSDLLLLWPDAGDSVGSLITYSAGTFTLGETGHFLVLVSDQYGTVSGTNNERKNVQTELTLAGTVLSPTGYSTGYIRQSSGSQEFINFSAAIIVVATTTGNGDELQVRSERIDNSTTGPSLRIADRSGICIIKLDDTWDYGRYESNAAFTPSATDNTRNTADIASTLEEDATFTRTGNVVDIASGNLILAVYSFQNDDSDTVSGRTEMQGVIDLAGVEVPGSWSMTYGPRVTDNCDWGGMSCMTLLEPTSGDDATLMLVSREDSDEDWFAAIQFVELPAAAVAGIVEATSGDFNAAATDFVWDTVQREDTGFTITAAQANIDCDDAGDYIAMVNQCIISDAGTGSVQRPVPAVQFRVEGVDSEIAGGSGYNRGNGTADHGGVNTAGLLAGLAANDSVVARNDRLGTVTTALATGAGALQVLSLASLADAGGPTINERTLTEYIEMTQH